MQQATSVRRADLKDLVRVRSVDDLGLMVKESELLTGKPGRDFVVVGADRPAFHVELDPLGYQFVRLDGDASQPLRTCATPSELANHTLGNALLCGMLYTQALH